MDYKPRVFCSLQLFVNPELLSSNSNSGPGFDLSNAYDPSRINLDSFKPKDQFCCISIAGVEFEPNPTVGSIADDYFTALIISKKSDSIENLLTREIFDRVVTTDPRQSDFSRVFATANDETKPLVLLGTGSEIPTVG